ncbi:hypothetical protein JR316_0005647 [Psilocybe cubensis]|uniref:Uncharacterized protein n=2 Tax=Psilocybe cubensis TaxID=181762 RepID=A0A8H7Y1Q3_PSICU|nr:hypothetical protein JR316_0005647 [Psilocybe cubensis]KAH9481127.1 hypothetical protein JR316_0005647 [Psilocybe cubensis]
MPLKPSTRPNTLHILELFAFTLPEIILMVALCCFVYPTAVPNFLSILLIFSFTAEHWLPTNEPDPTANIRTSFTRPRKSDTLHHTHIEIGGAQHGPQWKAYLNQSCGQALRTQSVMYNSKTFKVDLLWHCRSKATLDSLREVVNALSPPYSTCGTSASRTPGLELNVEVVKSHTPTDIVEAVDQPSLDLYRLSNLQKLTWKGSYPYFLFARPQYRTFGDILRGRTTEVMFPRLAELRLVDCNLQPGDMVEILRRCPVLTSCEIDQLRHNPDSTIYPNLHEHNHFGGHFGQWIATDADSSTSDIVSHPSLKHLKISSTLDLRQFFSSVSTPNLQSLHLQFSPWSHFPDSIQEYIPFLQVNWESLTHLDVIGPINHYSYRCLGTFFDYKPSLLGKWFLRDNRTL